MKLKEKINLLTDDELLDPAFFSRFGDLIQSRGLCIEAEQLGISGTRMIIKRFPHSQKE